MRKALIGFVIACLCSCGGDGTDNNPNNQQASPSFSFEYENGQLFQAEKFKAFALEAEEEDSKSVLIVASDKSGALAELEIKDINKTSSSLSVEKGSQAGFALSADDFYCTTALTMDNDSSINIDEHDPVTNFLTGHFLGFECVGNSTSNMGRGSFAVNYEEVNFENNMVIETAGQKIEPDKIYVSVTPEPVATIRITGFNGGTESYTLILKKDKYNGTYAMNEFDVTPYFFYSDADQNQYDARAGSVTIDTFDSFDRMLSGSFDVEMISAGAVSECQGTFRVFVF